jgi:hypothetical protein
MPVPAIVFIVVVLLVVLAIAAGGHRRYAIARDYVFANKDAAARDFAEAEQMAQRPEVTKETRNEFAMLKSKFSSIGTHSPQSEGVNWPIVKDNFDAVWSSLTPIISDMEEQIGFDRDTVLRGIPESAGSDS